MHTAAHGSQWATAPHNVVLHKYQSSVVVHVTAAHSRYAAEETARKAAAVRQQLRQHSSKHARQLHEQNVHIAELQQKVSLRGQRQATQHSYPQDQQNGQLQQQHQHQQHSIQERLSEVRSAHQRHQPARTAEDDTVTRQASSRLFGRLQSGSQQQQQQQQQTQRQQQGGQQHLSDAQARFFNTLQGVEVLVCSNSSRDWHQAAWQLQGIVVPLVAGPSQAAAAWQVMARLAGRQLMGHSRGLLCSAVASLIKVSLAYEDFSLLQRLLAPGHCICLGPRQLTTVITTAAAAGADTDTLAALLDLLPPKQLSSRAFFAVINTAINRRHFKVAQACLSRLIDRGIPLSPALQQRQQQVQAGLSAAYSRR